MPLKLAVLVAKSRGDPEQLSEPLEEQAEAGGGGEGQVMTLLDHVGMSEDKDMRRSPGRHRGETPKI